MIYVDANVFLRHLVAPATEQDERMSASATELFRQVERGEAEITTSDATIAEVVFILSSKRHFNSPRATVVTALKTLLNPENFKLSNKQACLDALDLWQSHPQLSYPDALAAAYAVDQNYELATFDEQLGRVSDITRYLFRDPDQDTQTNID